MTASHSPADVEILSSCLLKLGRVSREAPATEFLRQAIQAVRETIECRSVWWGLALDRGRSLDILLADFAGLPDSLAKDWRNLSEFDPFAHEMRTDAGRVKRLCIEEGRIQRLPVLTEFAHRYGIRYVMGVCLNDESTGQWFYTVMYRNADDPAFSDHDAALFLQFMRHVVQLWNFSLQDSLCGHSFGDIVRVALARNDGHLFYAGPELCEVIYSQWPDWDGMALPVELAARFVALPCSVKLANGMIDMQARGENVQLMLNPADAVPALSPRERRVAHLFATGLTYKEIARELKLSPATVRTYLRKAYERLGVSNKMQLSGALTGRHHR